MNAENIAIWRLLHPLVPVDSFLQMYSHFIRSFVLGFDFNFQMGGKRENILSVIFVQSFVLGFDFNFQMGASGPLSLGIGRLIQR